MIKMKKILRLLLLLVLFTSNLTLDEIARKYNDKERLYSRLCGACTIAKMDGKDMRVGDIPSQKQQKLL